MKNNEITQDFINGNISKTQNLFIEKDKSEVLVLYSYGYHFPLSIKLLDGVFLINKDGYSNTTSQHKGSLCRDLGFNSFKDLEKSHNEHIVLMDTDELKRVLDCGFKTYKEFIEDKI